MKKGLILAIIILIVTVNVSRLFIDVPLQYLHWVTLSYFVSGVIIASLVMLLFKKEMASK